MYSLLAGSNLSAPVQSSSGRLCALAGKRLKSFDVVGVTSCMRSYYKALGARLGWHWLRDESILDAAALYGKTHKPGSCLGCSRADFETVQASAKEPLQGTELSPFVREKITGGCEAQLFRQGLTEAAGCAAYGRVS